MSKPVLSTALILVAIVAATLAILHFKRAQYVVERAVSPGELSQPHAFLDNNCAACHTAGKGIEAQNCIVCHANNVHVLQRQPTAFHAEIAPVLPVTSSIRAASRARRRWITRR